MLWTRCPRCWEPPAASQPCAALPATLNSRKGEREGENKRKKDKGGMQTHRLQCWKLPAGITGASSQEGEAFLCNLPRSGHSPGPSSLLAAPSLRQSSSGGVCTSFAC